jgi:mono/diheme cytochrome c family protein
MSTRIWTMVFVILGAGLLVVAACSSLPNPPPTALTPIPTLAPGSTPTLVAFITPVQGGQGGATPASVAETPSGAEGVGYFLENCTGCHGVQGEGTDIAPALRNNAFITSGDQPVFQTIANGRGEMPAWLQTNGGPLANTQINDVITYLKALQGVAKLPVATPLPAVPTETPVPKGGPTPEPAHPSFPGGPGQAAALAGNAANGKPLFGAYCAECHGPEGRIGRPNPGSDDGVAPSLNPIDETIVNADPKVFAANMDLYLEHGSIPSGTNPTLMMPAFGDLKLLTQQQLADIIAYIISLNKQ